MRQVRIRRDEGAIVFPIHHIKVAHMKGSRAVYVPVKETYHEDAAEGRAAGGDIEENTGVSHGGEKTASEGQHGEQL